MTCCPTKALRHLRFQLPSFEADGLQQVRVCAFPDAMSRYVRMVIVMTHYDRFRDRLYDRLIIH